MTQRQQVTVDVHVILERAGQILLCLREGTGYADGLYCLPSGHLEAGETVVECAIREAREEVGVDLYLADGRVGVHGWHKQRRPNADTTTE